MPAKRMTRCHVIKKKEIDSPSEGSKPETPPRANQNRFIHAVGNASPERIFGVLTRSTSRVHTRYLWSDWPSGSSLRLVGQ